MLGRPLSFNADDRPYQTRGISIFLSKKNSPETAQRTLNKYTAHVKQYGKGINSLSKDNIKLVSYDMGNCYDVIFQKDSLIAGVTGVENESLALQAAVDLWKKL